MESIYWGRGQNGERKDIRGKKLSIATKPKQTHRGKKAQKASQLYGLGVNVKQNSLKPCSQSKVQETPT